ncbi:MAG TPA: LmeA family phospholipid-binding protein [Acidimicrobiales bacterium]|nr:LmeA family phospholipid-binding protein [Acidimicrobiales bacterium]
MRLAVLLVLAGLVALTAAEVVVPPRIEQGVEDRVARQVPEAGSVDATVRSFPVVARVVGTGRMEHLVVVLDDVVRPEVRIDSVRVDVRGIEVSRQALLDGEVDLQRIDSGALMATLTEEDLEEALPGNIADLRLLPGRAEVTVVGQTVGSNVTVRDGRVVFDLGPFGDAGVALPGQDFFPCPLEGEVVHGAVHLFCTLDEVPPYLLQRFQAAASAP